MIPRSVTVITHTTPRRSFLLSSRISCPCFIFTDADAYLCLFAAAGPTKVAAPHRQQAECIATSQAPNLRIASTQDLVRVASGLRI